MAFGEDLPTRKCVPSPSVLSGGLYNFQVERQGMNSHVSSVCATCGTPEASELKLSWPTATQLTAATVPKQHPPPSLLPEVPG